MKIPVQEGAPAVAPDPASDDLLETPSPAPRVPRRFPPRRTQLAGAPAPRPAFSAPRDSEPDVDDEPAGDDELDGGDYREPRRRMYQSRRPVRRESSNKNIVIIAAVAGGAILIVVLVVVLMGKSPYKEGYSFGLDVGHEMCTKILDADGTPDPQKVAQYTQTLEKRLMKYAVKYTDKKSARDFLRGYAEGIEKEYKDHTGKSANIPINSLLKEVGL
jgi:hypothetical protein